MTTEDDFQKALDANPSDWQTRLVFADWLQERGDERAEGYRALGMLRKNPCEPKNGNSLWMSSPKWDAQPYHYRVLPQDWFDLVELAGKSNRFLPDHSERRLCPRRELEDAVALAFSRLPAERRSELLATPLAEVPA